MADDLQIQCCKCDENLPADPMFFYRDRNGPHGFRSVCKACYSELPSIKRRTAERAAKVATRKASMQTGTVFSAVSVLTSLGRPASQGS
jgi:hypothetical protein